MKLILGSQSPRRSEILSYFNLPFTQISSTFDERAVIFSGDPCQYASEISNQKALNLKERYPHDLILTADTVVYFNNKVYNKPENEKEAFDMLKSFSGNWQSVFTAVTLYSQGQLFSEVEETKILFHSLTDSQIYSYLQNSDFLDKAGSYAIQKSGSIAIARIEGSFDNVMGLPIHATNKLLTKVNLNLWNHLKSF